MKSPFKLGGYYKVQQKDVVMYMYMLSVSKNSYCATTVRVISDDYELISCMVGLNKHAVSRFETIKEVSPEEFFSSVKVIADRWL